MVFLFGQHITQLKDGKAQTVCYLFERKWKIFECYLLTCLTSVNSAVEVSRSGSGIMVHPSPLPSNLHVLSCSAEVDGFFFCCCNLKKFSFLGWNEMLSRAVSFTTGFFKCKTIYHAAIFIVPIIKN